MMFAIVWFAICLAAISLVLVASGLYVKAKNRQVQDVVYDRFKLQGNEDQSTRKVKLESDNPVIRLLNKRLMQAGYEPTEKGILIGIASIILLAVIFSGVWGALMSVLIVTCILLSLHIFLLQRSSSRLKTLTLQLPEFMDRLLRPLIAGNTIEESFAIATRESPEPIRGLFMGVARQVRFGAPLEDALSRVATVHEIVDLHILSMATQVHRRYGGSIREMVKSLMHMMRSRESATQELRALTAETRMSAWVLVIIPMAITSYILMRNPDYYAAMWGNPTGRGILITGFVLQFLGTLVIWRMMRSTAGVKL